MWVLGFLPDSSSNNLLRCLYCCMVLGDLWLAAALWMTVLVQLAGMSLSLVPCVNGITGPFWMLRI